MTRRFPAELASSRPRRLRSRALFAATTVSLLLLTPYRTALAQAASPSASIRYVVEAGRLADALATLARQAGISVEADPALVRGIDVSATRGDEPVASALEHLLAPYRLQAVARGDGRYVVQAARVATTDAARLDQVTVTGRAETSTSAVDGYKANISATATRIDVPLKNQPIAVVVIPKTFIDDIGSHNLTETADYVAGVSRETTGYAPGGQSFFIRGFSTYGSGNTLNGYRVDGFLGATDPSAVERIEFLKGPAAVLYGASSAISGLANTVTKRPTANAFANIDVTYGRFGYARATVDADAPLGSDALLGRVNLAVQRDEGYRSFSGSPINTVYAIDPIVAARLSDTTRVEVELSAIENRYGGRCDGVYPVAAVLAQSYRKQLVCDRLAHADIGSYDARVDVVQDLSERWSLRAGGFFGRATSNRTEQYPNDYANVVDPDGHTISRYSQYVYSYSLSGTAQLDLRGRFETGPFTHRLITGIERTGSRSQYQFFEAPATPMDLFDTRYDGRLLGPYTPDGPADYNTSLSNAWYLQDFVELGGRWKLLAGFRRDRVRSTGGEIGTGVVFNRQSEAGSSPRLGVVYDVLPATALYASAARSFSPNAGSRSRGGDVFPSERGVQYEVGVKQELLDGKVGITASVFDLKRRNVLTSDPTDPTGTFSIATGLQRSRGVELEVLGRVAPWWQVIAAYTGLDAKVVEDNFIPVGDRPVGAARHSGSLWNKVGFGPWSLPEWSAGIGVVAATNREAQLPNIPVKLGGYARIDLGVFYDARPWHAQLNLRNATDRRIFDGQGSLLYPQTPRALQGTIGYRF